MPSCQTHGTLPLPSCCQPKTKPQELLSAVTFKAPRPALSENILLMLLALKACSVALGAIPLAAALMPLAIIVPATCVAWLLLFVDVFEVARPPNSGCVVSILLHDVVPQSLTSKMERTMPVPSRLYGAL